MNTWKTIKENLERVDLDHEAAESFNDASKAYTQLNTEQMYQGKNKLGEDIVPEYANSTIQIKKRKGQPFDRVTLHDTGEFYNRTFAVAEGDVIHIDSDVSYTKYLVEKYGSVIFGLDKENKKEFVFGPYRKVLNKRIENITGLKFQ